MCLVKECRELERALGTQYTERLLKEGGELSTQQLKQSILGSGREALLVSCSMKVQLVAKIMQQRTWVGSCLGRGTQWGSSLHSTIVKALYHQCPEVPTNLSLVMGTCLMRL